MELIEIIKAYVGANNTDYAILINGNWGSGKTYFLKNVVKPAVKKIDCRADLNDIKKFDIVYVSLYGISSIDELQKTLFLEINWVLKSKPVQLFNVAVNKVSSFFKVTIDKKDEKALLNIFGGIPKNRILIFDDLERLGDGMLTEVLGFINTYTEHENLKVILLADEEKIKAKNIGYPALKEKLIRFSYLYAPDLKTVYPNFVNRYQSQLYKTFLGNDQSRIIGLFEKGKHNNLRTLRFTLDLMESIFQQVTAVANVEEATRKTILSRFLLFTITYSIEYKKGEPEKYLQALKSLSRGLGDPSPGFMSFTDVQELFAENKGGGQQQQDPQDEFISKFNKTYLEEGSVEFEYYDFLVNHIHSGDLSNTTLIKTVTDANTVLVDKRQKPEEIVLSQFDTCLTLNDDQFIPVVQKVLEYVDAGDYILEKYPPIFQTLVNCATRNLSVPVIDPALVARFKAGMEKSLGKSIYKSSYENIVSRYMLTNALLQEVRDYGIQLNEFLRKERDKEQALAIFKKIFETPFSEFIQDLTLNNLANVPLFRKEYFTPQQLMERYEPLSNKDKIPVNDFFSQLTSRYTINSHRLVGELEFFEELSALVATKIPAQTPKPVSVIQYENLDQFIKTIIKKLTDLKADDAGVTVLPG